jgi:hypothetical protein
MKTCVGGVVVRGVTLLCSAAALFGPGCQTNSDTSEYAPNSALRRIESPPGATETDSDRAALARFIGVWNFEGQSLVDGSLKPMTSGRAAASIEDVHFVLLDLEATAGELSGRAGRKSGSMVFASEPGIGLTLTAWGDASPSITRLVGGVEGDGSRFNFNEMKTPPGLPRHSITITFETDDRWVAEFRNVAASGRPVVARYQFTRAG